MAERNPRKRRDPFDIFGDFDEMFEELIRSMETGRIGQGGPFFYGRSWSVRPGEEPEVREFGNIRPGEQRLEIGERRPLVDVFDADGTVHVVAEMPGIEKEDVELSIDDRELEIKASRGDRQYHETVELPADVDDSSAKATYKNGVLEITLKKKGDNRKRKKIDVE
ncbi:archaeal heat shock protein Hsp20 [Methanocella arvoryzae]|uniref:Chaperonin Hsp20 n=1 Tax=Methanocella arvoryzae (strain DSM 22066 / NBRC 105507 / MRE50) TaxID=351160 RepID=Q0W6B5_METAR|nr:archaeal heat shock protein Hsp20 [Methanocella arvoryzae]CAJ36078.1 chaperonin Hsp20 [Methanocella arvoryzae MRE50]